MANDIILRNDLSGLIPEETANSIIQDTLVSSAVMNLAEVVPMTTPTKKFPVLLDGPGAYWVGEGERITTSKAKWATVEMTAKKLAVIIPIPKESLNDAKIQVFEELKPKIAEAFSKKFDQAALFGVDSPFATNIYTGATTEGNVFARASVVNQDITGDVSDVMALVEDNNEDVNGFTTYKGMKNTLRKLRDNNGNPIYVSGVKDGAVDTLYDVAIEFVDKSVFDKAKAELIAGNWSKAYYGILQGIEYEISTDATLENTVGADGKALSLFEQDLIALKATMRIAFLVVKPAAFALLTPVDTTAPTATMVSTGSIVIPANVVVSSNELGTVYLVPETETPATRLELDALVSGGTAAKANVTMSNVNANVNIASTGLTAGDYVAYAVDQKDNVSEASESITLATE